MSGVFVMRIYKCNKNQRDRRDSELIGNMGNGNFKFLVLYGTTPGDPAKAIKENWNDLEDGYYIVKVSCGSVHLASLYRIDNGEYGSALILGYGFENPFVLRMSGGVWSPERSLILSSDLFSFIFNAPTTSGYVEHYDSRIRGNTIAIVSNLYTGEVKSCFYTVQCEIGRIVVYIRNSSGAIVADGTKFAFAVICMND